jgi:Flp pilus assembly protein TadG
MFAIVLVVLMGLAAFALDTGNGWQERRNMITATDAAALAAIEHYAEGTDGCSTVPAQFVNLNESAASVTACNYTAVAPGAGYVTVQAQRHIDFTFARVIGFDGTDVHSSTTAAFGVPTALSGLRPLGLCDQSAGYLNWIASGMVTPFTQQIYITKASPNDCGADAPGNWGQLQLDPNCPGDNCVKDQWANGYQGMVNADTWIGGKPGAFSDSLSGALDALKASGQAFQLPVYDLVGGNGRNAQFFITGFVTVVLVNDLLTGPESGRYITVQFQTGVAQGTCCSHGQDTGTRVVFICAVDPIFDPTGCTNP